MAEKIYIGTTKKSFERNTVIPTGSIIYIEKHNWACDWYWSFGWIGNKNMHMHFSAFMSMDNNSDCNMVASEIFQKPVYSDSTWWVIRDLFKQAYALQKCAEVYRYGGHQTSKEGTTDIIKDDAMCTRLNADLKTVLDKLWSVLENDKIKED